MNSKTSLVFLLLMACADGNNGDADSDTGMDSDTDTERDEYNPQNPLAEGPAPVDMGDADGGPSSAGSYVLLAKSAISNVTGSAVSGGSVGLSPSAATFITGMTLVVDPTGVYATSIAVPAPGKVYAANYAVPTPTDLTTAVLDMQAGYEDAAIRWPPDELDLSSGAIGGLTLEPGLYTWGSSVTVPTDLTFAGGADDVWILQMSGDLDVGTGTQVILSGGADASNIYWQVAGQATIRANAHFEGILLSSTGVTLQTNASVHGRIMAQTMIALDDNAVTAP